MTCRVIRSLAPSAAVGVVVAIGALPVRLHAADDAAAAARAGARVVAEDGPLRATLTVSDLAPALGAPVTLRVDARAGELGVRLPDVAKVLRDSLGEDVVEVSETARDRGTRTAVLHLYDVGAHALPPFEVRAGDAHVVSLAGPTLTVPAVATEQDELLPGHGAVLHPAAARGWWWAAGGGALLLAALLAWAWTRRRRAADADVAEAPPPLPHEVALAALARLAARRLPESGRVEPYFVRLSEIARRYVEDRFGLRAPELTTDEFLVTAARTADRGLAPHRDMLSAFLLRADLVKFARDEPDLGTSKEALDDVRVFVLATSRLPVAPGEDAIDVAGAPRAPESPAAPGAQS